MVNQLAYRFRNATAAALEPLGITPPELRLLGLIAADQPLTQAQLSMRSGFDRTSTMRQLDELQRRGLVSRETRPTDRRAHDVVLTPAGQTLLAVASVRAAAVEAEILAPLAAADVERLFAIMSALGAPHVKLCPDPEPPEKETE